MREQVEIVMTDSSSLIWLGIAGVVIFVLFRFFFSGN